MREIIIYVLIGLLLLVAYAALGAWNQDRCEKKGGEYYQSIWVGKSLCHLKK